MPRISEDRKNERAVVLLNLGSPASPTEKDVRVYLREFLMDKRVLDTPYLIRKFVVEATILPNRPAESAEAYQCIWSDEGSPLVAMSKRVRAKLEERVGIPVGTTSDLTILSKVGKPPIGTILTVDGISVFPFFVHGGVTISSPDAQFLRGDANSNGGINISDPIFVLSYLFSMGNPPPCFDAADTNDNGAVNSRTGLSSVCNLPVPAKRATMAASPT